jgi:hypothetical protein
MPRRASLGKQAALVIGHFENSLTWFISKKSTWYVESRGSTWYFLRSCNGTQNERGVKTRLRTVKTRR